VIEWGLPDRGQAPFARQGDVETAALGGLAVYMLTGRSAFWTMGLASGLVISPVLAGATVIVALLYNTLWARTEKYPRRYPSFWW